MAFSLDNYVMVNERVAEFWQRHPKGRIATSVLTHTEKLVVIYAEVYRDEQDDLPAATGHSQLGIPGSTPYTKGSEIENCETSAVGRALGMLGIGSERSIASREEVASKSGGEEIVTSTGDPSRVTGFVEKLTKDGFSLKAGMTRYQVVAASDEIAVGDKVEVTGPITRVAWTNADGKKMPPFKQIVATTITSA